MAQRQLNLRLDEGTWEVLELLAFVEKANVIDVVRPVVEKFARERADEPGLSTARRARKENEAYKLEGAASATPHEGVTEAVDG